MLKQFLNRYIPLLFILILVFVHFNWMIKANSDLSDGAFALHMDELITVRGIKAILHPASFESFYHMVTDGNDHRYGRILWNTNALISFLPERVWGEQGLIIANRLAQCFFLILSYLILSFTFLKGYWLRILSLFLLLSLPFTYYFAYIPKPEPIQLFFLSLFLFDLIKFKGERLIGWVFLGLAFGAKISLFPYSIFIIALYGITNGRKKLLKVSLSFLAGFCIAVPSILLMKFSSYLESTFLNTGHGIDDSNVTAITWIEYFFGSYFQSPKVISFVLFVIILLLIIYVCRRTLLATKFKLDFLYSPDLALLICSMSFILPIFLKVKRVWGFYLHIGTVLLFVWILICVEDLYKKNKPKSYKITASIIVLVLMSIGYFGSVFTKKMYYGLSKRTASEQYVSQREDYKELIKFLEMRSIKLNRKIKVSLDPHYFQPESTERYQIENFWGPFNNWDYNYDVIVLYSKFSPDEALKKLSPTNLKFTANVVAKNNFDKHVTNCKNQNCYQLVPTPAHIILLTRKESNSP